MGDNRSEVSNTRKAVKGISEQSVVTISTGVVEIISFSIMSRLLTKEDFGYYAVIMAIVTVFRSFSETGIGSAIIQRKNIDRNYIDNAFTLCFLIGAILSCSLLSLAGIISHAMADAALKVPLMLMSVTLLLFCITSVSNSIMIRRLQFLRVGMIQLIASVLSTVVAVVLALQKMGYYAILAKGLFSAVLIWGLSTYFAHTRYRLSLDRKTSLAILHYSGWLMASVFFRNMSNQIDRLLMPRLLSIGMLGAYNRPKDFVEQLVGRINAIFDTALFPILSKFQDQPEKLQSALKRSLYYLSILSGVLCIGVALNSDFIICLFFGKDWMSLRPLFVLFAILMLCDVNGRLADCYLRSLAMTKQQFYFRILETVTATIGVLLGSLWGLYGIACFVVLCKMCTKLLKFGYVASKLGLGFFEVMGIMVRAWRFAWVVIPLCLVVYILIQPSSLLGASAMLAVYILILVTVFLYAPSVVGQKYKNEVYVRVVSYVKRFMTVKH